MPHLVKKSALSKTLSNFTSFQNENKENSFAIQDQQKEPISSNFDKENLDTVVIDLDNQQDSIVVSDINSFDNNETDF